MTARWGCPPISKVEISDWKPKGTLASPDVTLWQREPALPRRRLLVTKAPSCYYCGLRVPVASTNARAAGGGDLAGEEPAEIIARLDDRAILGHVGERVHLLGAGNARHHVRGDDICAVFLRLLQKVLVLGWVEKRDQRLVRR